MESPPGGILTLCRPCEIAAYLEADGWDEQAPRWHRHCKKHGCECNHGRPVTDTPNHPAVPHPVHLRIRRHREGMGKVGRVNDWLATHLAVVFGVCWTIWVFFTVPLIAYFLPQNIQGHIFFFSSGWIQLFALPLMVYVGNKLQRSSDAQSEVIHQALTHIAMVSDKVADLLDLETAGGLAAVMSEVKDAKIAAETAGEAMKMLTAVLAPKTPMNRKAGKEPKG